MNKRKYPTSMFIMGTILNLIKIWYCFIAVIIVFIICRIKPAVPITLPFVMIGILILIAIFQQFRNRKVLLSDCGNEENNESLDKMFADNSKGYKNVKDAVDELIKNYEND